MGMILYAKSSLELIVNNRIGKVGIRPLEPPSPILFLSLPTNRLASLICHRSQRTGSLSVCRNVCPPVCSWIRVHLLPTRSDTTVSDIHVRTNVAEHIRVSVPTYYYV